ncbi:hypothetical protein HBH56_016930 [Parastagonospora nodorum]|uniref:Uncharacterized protein n=1 Tax=Phaeosphaeria nodorum (strain SN15 / ATCC MYA-4574 / FGSC 10173) TaxID=321614 RepID=A0A7U2HYA8_PHANO|nr:hypothetical protein HBH56_016930 [Parastagonospora nodorum]QRC95143.1 hypothetical protein JI435_028640 [Parastagonospora nodorum SN15]KAH3936973.1 hypothetical protein HBH54_017540 [Parastagonospora nodorum]KAH3953893.1 hypothetical protein HBH53_029910 [Parastagonospora nodorum]KAH3962729.1 hypothetical protein HBH51_172070 [Parastagonospora nodorum]
MVAKQSADWHLLAPIQLFSSLTSGITLAICAHMEAPKDGKAEHSQGRPLQDADAALLNRIYNIWGAVFNLSMDSPQQTSHRPIVRLKTAMRFSKFGRHLV